MFIKNTSHLSPLRVDLLRKQSTRHNPKLRRILGHVGLHSGVISVEIPVARIKGKGIYRSLSSLAQRALIDIDVLIPRYKKNMKWPLNSIVEMQTAKARLEQIDRLVAFEPGRDGAIKMAYYRALSKFLSDEPCNPIDAYFDHGQFAVAIQADDISPLNQEIFNLRQMASLGYFSERQREFRDEFLSIIAAAVFPAWFGDAMSHFYRGMSERG